MSSACPASAQHVRGLSLEAKPRGVGIRLDRGGHDSQACPSLCASGSGPYPVGWHMEALRPWPVSPELEHGLRVPWSPWPGLLTGVFSCALGCRAQGCVQRPHSHSRESVLYAMVLLGSQRGEFGLPFPKLGSHLGYLGTLGTVSASGTRQAQWPRAWTPVQGWR